MQTKNDAELLNDYAATRSEAAFGEIVRRYADFVYSAALRQVGDPEQARDVAQVVFTDLARKAGSLGRDTVVIGWLCHGARLAALAQLRTDRRRLERERQAMELLDPPTEPPDDWNAIRPVLDEAIASLGQEDRNALLLRFFKDESLASVGAVLGVSEDAAQKRVSRALDKLRDFLQQRGIRTTAAALSVVLAAHAVQAAPSGFAMSLTSGALAKAAIAGGSSVPISKLITIANMKIAALIIVLAGGIAALASLQVKSQRQLHEAQSLADRRAEEIAALRAAHDDSAMQSNELNRLRGEAADAVRLRGDIARLRREIADLKTVPAAQPAIVAPEKAPTAPQQISIRTSLFSVPAARYPAQEPLAFTDLRARDLAATLEKTDGVTVLGRPQVVTLCGRQAQVQVSSINADDTAPGGSFSLDVLPECSSDSSDISLLLVSRFVDTAEISASPGGAQAVAVPTITEMFTTNSIRLRDGESVVMPLSGGATESKRNLLILVTPTLINPDGNRTHP